MPLSRSKRKWPAWWLAVILVVTLACTVGEAPPQPAPSPDPGAAPGDPVEDTAAAAAPSPVAETERAAAELVMRARLAYEAVELGEALDLSRRALRDYPDAPSAVAAAWVGARAAFALGLWPEAEALAEGYAEAVADAGAVEEARALAELARDEQAPPSDAPVRLGVLLPRTGTPVMVRYADWVLQGVQVAAREGELRERRTIELVVADDAGGTRTREAVAELERQGVIAIVGPLLPQQLAAVAGSRSDGSLVAVSPTAPDQPPAQHLYSVNAPDARGAQELGRYAYELGLTQAALLYPRSPAYERKASAFAVEFEALGGELRAAVPYDSGTTTFGTHIRRILAAVAPSAPLYDSVTGFPLDTLGAAPPQQPFALFVAAPDRDVRQIAPQVAFYGLDSAGVQVFGDEAWSTPAVRRVVPAPDLEGVIAASHLPPGRAEALADPEFVRRYEEMFRRSLENRFPALGYDAANLVLQALPNRVLTPRAVARRVSLLAGIRGATGTLSIRADRVVRTPYLVIIRDGALALAPAPWEYRLPQPIPPSDTTGGGGGAGRP